MPEHTPGPWEVDFQQEEVWGERTTVIDGVRIGHMVWAPEDLAELNPEDARLIAAAPETAAERDRLRELLDETQMQLNAWILQDSKHQRVNAVLLAALQLWRRYLSAVTPPSVVAEGDAALAQATDSPTTQDEKR